MMHIDHVDGDQAGANRTTNMNTYDNQKATGEMESLARGTGASARFAEAVIAAARENWGGDIASTLADAAEGNVRVPGLTGAAVAAFAARLHSTVGQRPLTAEEIAARQAEAAARAEQARITATAEAARKAAEEVAREETAALYRARRETMELLQQLRPGDFCRAGRADWNTHVAAWVVSRVGSYAGREADADGNESGPAWGSDSTTEPTMAGEWVLAPQFRGSNAAEQQEILASLRAEAASPAAAEARIAAEAGELNGLEMDWSVSKIGQWMEAHPDAASLRLTPAVEIAIVWRYGFSSNGDYYQMLAAELVRRGWVQSTKGPFWSK